MSDTDRSRVVVATMVLVAFVAAVVAAGGSVAAAQDEAGTTTGDEATTGNVSASVDAARETSARISALEPLVDSTVVQYLGGLGIGLGVGLCIGGVAMYVLQSRRIEETFE